MMILGHVGIIVSDLDRSEQFYSSIFQLRTVWKAEGDKAFLSSGHGDSLGLQVGKPCPLSALSLTPAYFDAEGNTEKFIHFGYNCVDEAVFRMTLAHAADNGIEATAPHVSRDGTTACYIVDPDGYVVQITLVGGAYVDDLPGYPPGLATEDGDL